MFLTIIASSQAQHFVKGCVQDSLSVLPDANVLFFQNDSLTAGIYTDKNGCFSIRLDTGKYVMNILFLGYKDYADDIVLNTGDIHLSSIVLQTDVTELGEIVVSEKEKAFESKLNRDIYRIPASVKKSSSDVFRALQDIPVLSVDEYNKSISLIGADNSIVLVNNVRRNREYLQLIQPENIDRVEVSHSPGARYFVKGVDGIINIITKTPTEGYSGYLKGEVNPVTFNQHLAEEGGFNYVTSKAIASISAGDNYYHSQQDDFSIIRDVNGVHTEKRNNGKYDNVLHIPRLAANLDYSLSPQTFITFNTNYSGNPARNKIPYTVQQYSPDGTILNDFNALQEAKSKHDSYNANAYFQTAFKEKRSMNVDIDYSLAKSKSDENYDESNGAGYQYVNHQVNRNNRQSVNSQINFQQENTPVEWEEGIRIQWQDNRFHSDINHVLETQQEQRLQSYFYVNVLGSIGERFIYQMENIFDMVKMTNKTQSTHVYKGFTPRIMLRYFIDDSQNLTFDGDVTHNYPDFSLLNPISSYIDSSRIITGNPHLKPYFRYGFRLTHQLGRRPRIKSLFIRTSVSYRIMNGYISQKEDLDNNGIRRITYLNAGFRSNLQFQINGSVDIFKDMKLMLEGSARQVTFKDDNQAQFNKQFWEYTLSYGIQFRYKNFYANYRHIPTFRTPTLTGYRKDYAISHFTASYTLNRHWDLSATFWNFFPRTYRSETYMDNYTEIYTNTLRDEQCVVYLSLRYNFQKGIQRNKKSKQTKQYGNVIDSNIQKY
jgi:hypothetical protein